MASSRAGDASRWDHNKMIKTILLSLAFILLLVTSPNSSGTLLIGENLGDQFIYTSRKAWEKDYKKEALDKNIYRLGKDLVVFVGRKSSGKPDLLEMTPAKNFTQKELLRFKSASLRKDIPPRNHDFFKNLNENGFQSQK
jgi:hypothetical protein